MKHSIITTLCVLFAATAAMAYPTQVIYDDGPQDTLFVPEFVHELGMAPMFDAFPDELIDAFDQPVDITVCFDTAPDNIPDDPDVPNAMIRMVNLTGIDWKEVWYVADEDTYHSNYDGWVGDLFTPVMGTAFRIDRLANDPLGVHHPLFAESMTPDGIFEAGEMWEFVIQDYSNALGIPASALGSIGVPSPSGIAGFTDSSGSIIAVPVPEPTTITLIGMGALALIRKRRKYSL